MFSVRGGSGLLRTWAAHLTSQAPIPRPNVITPALSRGYAAPIHSRKKQSIVNEALARSDVLYKKYKPLSPGLRHLLRPLHPHLYAGRPVRALTIAKRKTGGRNAHGHITVRHRGGGHKQRIRTLDFTREEPGVHDVVRIEYDPGRSAHIALIRSRDPKLEGTKKWSYILATEGMRAGDEVQSFRQGIPADFIPGFEDLEEVAAGDSVEGEEAAPKFSAETHAVGLLRTMTLKPGNVLPLRLIPIGTIIHNICLAEQGPGRLVRAAGTFAVVMLHEGEYAHVRLQSGEVRKVKQTCCASIGKVSNIIWNTRQLGKAGRSRWLGRRPSVRGVAMNANDHPHGGGRGKSKSNKHPVSIWGWGTKGTRTRRPSDRNGNKMVVLQRPRGPEKR